MFLFYRKNYVHETGLVLMKGMMGDFSMFRDTFARQVSSLCHKNGLSIYFIYEDNSDIGSSCFGFHWKSVSCT